MKNLQIFADLFRVRFCVCVFFITRAGLFALGLIFSVFVYFLLVFGSLVVCAGAVDCPRRLVAEIT